MQFRRCAGLLSRVEFCCAAQDVPKVGLQGEVVAVQPGYGRNYLIPNQSAMYATKQNLAAMGIGGAAKKEEDKAAGEQSSNAVTIASRKLFDEMKGILNGLSFKVQHPFFHCMRAPCVV